MIQLCATRCSCVAILWVSLVSFAAIILCIVSERVFLVVSVYIVMTQSGNFWIHIRMFTTAHISGHGHHRIMAKRYYKNCASVGLVTVPAGGGGTFLGGYLVKRLSLHCAGIIKFCVIATFIGITFTTCFFLSCPNLTFAGVTEPYGNNRLVSNC